MSVSAGILKADHVGIREFKEHLSLKTLKNILVITEHGRPVSVNLPYEDLMELIDIIEEISDEVTIKAVAEARKEYKSGSAGIPAKLAFKKHKETRK